MRLEVLPCLFLVFLEGCIEYGLESGENVRGAGCGH